MFTIHSWKSNDEMLDLPAAAEYTWHGACLACAEFTRRDLISARQLPDMIPWVVKALHFDIRKGTHSVGSSVRDAAAYVLWSLARSQDAGAIRPFAEELAKELVITSLYDREIHIRRAASAAYQENVGRMVRERTRSLFVYSDWVLRACSPMEYLSLPRSTSLRLASEETPLLSQRQTLQSMHSSPS